MDRSAPLEDQRSSPMPTARACAIELLLSGAWGERREPAPDAPAGRTVPAHALLRNPAHDSMASRSEMQRQPQTGRKADAANGPGSHLSQAAIVRSWARRSHLSVSSAEPGDHQGQSGLEYRYNLHPSAARLCIPRSHHGLVQPLCPELGTVRNDGDGLLHIGPGLGSGQRLPGYLQHGPGRTVYQPCIYRAPGATRHPGEHGRPRPLSRQRLCRATVAHSEIRGSLSEGLWERSGSARRSIELFRILQSGTTSPGTRLQNARRDSLWEKVVGDEIVSSGKKDQKEQNKNRKCVGLMENAASVEIRKKRGFPRAAWKSPAQERRAFPTFPTGPYWDLFLNGRIHLKQPHFLSNEWGKTKFMLPGVKSCSYIPEE